MEVIRNFISDVKEYNKHPTEVLSQNLQRYLKILSTISDNSIFDPNSKDGPEFYVNLYNLMSSLDSRSVLIWCLVSVLQEASKNPSALHALINKYKFSPLLSGLLNGNLIFDKQIQILKLLQDFTYGVKILWLESHLPSLISILITFIKSNDKSSELVCLSLGILVNLCYKNLPAIYVLRSIIDIKDFIGTLLPCAKDTLEIRVKAYKLMVILEEVIGEQSENSILTQINWIFKTIPDAFMSNNLYAMRHLVDFFKNLKDNNNFKNVLNKHHSYASNLEKILKITEVKNDVDESNCVVLLLDFLRSAITVQVKGLEKLFESLVEFTVGLSINSSDVSQASVKLLCTIMAESRRKGKNIHNGIIKQLEVPLPNLLAFLKTGTSSENLDISLTSSLLCLLSELSHEPATHEWIVTILQPAVIESYFQNILSTDLSRNGTILDESCITLRLQAISLVSSLSVNRNDWAVVLNKLLQLKELKFTLAASLYSESLEVRYQALKLISQLSNVNGLLYELSHHLLEIMKLAPVMSSNDVNHLNSTYNNSFSISSQHIPSPLLSVAQQERFNNCISSVQQAIANNQLDCIGISAFLELNEFKDAARSQAESVLQNNLQALDKYCTQLRHNISIMTSEMNNLLKNIQSKEQSLESSQMVIFNQKRDLSMKEAALEKLQKKYSEDMKIMNKTLEDLAREKGKENEALKSDLENKNKTIDQLESTNKNLEQTVMDKDREITHLTEILDDITKRVMRRV